MLNFFYVYSILWGAVLFLYSLGWSDLCSPLKPSLVIFFISTIVISFFLGIAFKDLFRFKRIKAYPDRDPIITIFICFMAMCEYAYCRQIPLFSIITGSSGYTSFTGIPTFHTILSTFASFYAQYIFYLFICFPKKRRLVVEFVVILTMVFVFQFNRGQVLINAFVCLAMLSSSLKGKIKPRHIMALVLLTIVAMYIFGGMGNMRHGYAWNDSSYIEALGKYNEAFPDFLPKQFMWSYNYITSPLSNLNYNVNQQYSEVNILNSMIMYLPDFISKRVFPVVYKSEPLLVVSYFTATAAFGKAYLYGGHVGIVIFYLTITLGQVVILLFSNNRVRDEFKMPMIGVMSAIVAFTFFTHTISYSAISFMIVYPLLSVFYSRSFRFRLSD